MTNVVLDASAVIAILRSEPGADTVRASLAGAVISAVNYSEVLKKSIERGAVRAVADGYFRTLSVVVIPFDEALAGLSADLYPQTKEYGLSMADRACLALGIQRNCKVLTSERRMALPSLPIKVKLIRHEH